MRTVLGLVFVLFGFIATGQSLQCQKCTSYSDTPCTGALQDCPSPNDACGATLIRNRGFRWTSFYYIRSCVNTTECFNDARVTGLYATTTSYTTCCFSGTCDPPLPILQQENYTLNGLLCPSYVETVMEPCAFKNVSACTGNQTNCIRYSARTTLGSTNSVLYLGGCATQNTCNAGYSYVSGDGVSIEIKRKCYNNASTLYTRAVSCGLPILLLLLRLVSSPYVSL